MISHNTFFEITFCLQWEKELKEHLKSVNWEKNSNSNGK